MVQVAPRQGSLNLVNTERIKSRGAFAVVEARVMIFMKYLPALLSVAVANPFLYLLAVGVGVGKLINAHSGGCLLYTSPSPRDS